MRNLHLILTVCTVVKSKVEISQNFVAFSEYMNFNAAHPVLALENHLCSNDKLCLLNDVKQASAQYVGC